ncbi:RING-H2 finger protein ATL78 [Striga hermonthica]|uniref:RING-type E3 ubiquitin transferase n=1 Tax=Striga hermonthica TaxID=68872 RepID=A0A9N7NGG9_STRHE|nr:RING-H2 finger protein ATL78 [Striga hermonthica]
MSSLHSRRLLLQNQSYAAIPPPPGAAEVVLPRENTSFDSNVVMVLSVLLCALICSLALSSITRCALRCSRLVAANPSPPTVPPNTGIKRKALRTYPTISYRSSLEMLGQGTECAICLSDFASGERVRVLPTCRHGFHVRCIDKWLNSHSSCPTCRHCLLGRQLPAVPAQDNAFGVTIQPLQPEGLIRGHEI